MDLYVIVLRLLQLFVLQRQELVTNDPNHPHAQDSQFLNGAIFRCVYQAVNCASDEVTSIILPILPLLPSLMEAQSNDNYFDVEKNVEVVRKIEQEITAGKDVPLHYMRRIRILLPLFPNNGRELILRTTLSALKHINEFFLETSQLIKETAMTTVSQMLEIVGSLHLTVSDFDELWTLAYSLLDVLTKKCPFLAHDRIIVLSPRSRDG